MTDLEGHIETHATTLEPNDSESAAANERYHQILMRLLDESKREFDKWPEWKKQYSITTRPY